jgi:hypothetical protein
MIWQIQFTSCAIMVITRSIADESCRVLDATREIANIIWFIQDAIHSELGLPILTQAERRRIMARIRLNLRNLTITEKVAKGRQIITAMSNNASFPSPSPALTQIATKLDDLDKAFALVQSAKSEVSTRVVVQENAETEVDQMLTQLAGYVESVAGRDNTLITSAGMETKTNRSTSTTPSEPQGLSAAAGSHEGVVRLSWKAVPNAKSYTIEASNDPATPASWTHVAIATSATKAINNLKTGTRYWFRVAAIGAGGQSGWSEHATKVVP